METVACRLTEQSASFTFSDGHHEDLKKHAIDQSSVIQDVLLEGQEQQDVTVTAPRTYLRSWCHLHKLLADSGSVEAAPLDKLVDFLEAADFFADKCAMAQVQLVLASQLFRTKQVEVARDVEEISRPILGHGALKAMRRLHENLVTGLLRTALKHRFVNLDDLISLIPRPLVASALQSASLEGPCSDRFEINCFQHTTATTTAILAHFTQLTQASELYIKTMACKKFRSRAYGSHCSSLRAALEHAMLCSMSVSLQVVVHCRFSLEFLMQRVSPACGAVHKLELSDGRSFPLLNERVGRLSAPAVRMLRSLTSLQSLSLEGFFFPSIRAPVFRALVDGIRRLSRLTQLTISRCVRGNHLKSILAHVPQLRCLDACCVVLDSQELQDLDVALSSLSQLTSLTLSECGWSKAVRMMLFRMRWDPQDREVNHRYLQAIESAWKEVKSNRAMTECYLSLVNSFLLGHLTVPSSSSLQVLDLSKCCMSDEMMAEFFLDPSKLCMLQKAGFAVCTPGPNTLFALEALQTCSALTSLTLTADRASLLITEDFERHLCALKSLKSLNLCNCTVRESMLNRLPLLTALTGLSELHLEHCVPAVVTDEQFFKGLGHLTALVTVSLCHVPMTTVAASVACAGAFHQLSALKSLKLAHLNALEDASNRLCDGLGHVPDLTHLSLGALFNSAMPLLHTLCTALHEMTALQELEICNMFLDAQCGRCLAQAVASPALSGLQRLQVKSCEFDNFACEAFQSGFVASPVTGTDTEQYSDHLGLRELEWSYSALRDEDMQVLGVIISRFPRLKTCSLQGIGVIARQRFPLPVQQALMRLQELQHLKLHDNNPWSAGDMKRLELLARHSRQLREIETGALKWQPSVDARAVADLRCIAARNDPFKCCHLYLIGRVVSDILRVKVFVHYACLGIMVWSVVRWERKTERRQQLQNRERLRVQRQFAIERTGSSGTEPLNIMLAEHLQFLNRDVGAPRGAM